MILLLSALAFAHHDTVVSRVSASPSASAASLAVPLPRAEMGLSASMDRFNRVLWEDDWRAQKLEQGASLATLSPSLGLRLKSQTALVVTLPVGQVFYGDGTQERGLSDLRLGVAQSLSRPKRPWSLDVQAGLSAPTGRYLQDTAWTATTLETPSSGEALVLTSDSRISLGMGTFALSASGVARLEQGRNAWVLSGSAVQPVGWTSDAIWWGRDLSVSAGGLRSVNSKGRVQVGGTVQGALHSENRMQVSDDHEGEKVLRRGARQELLVNGVATVGVRENLGCGIAVQVPVVQHADSIQLVRSAAVSTQCGVGLSTRR